MKLALIGILVISFVGTALFGFFAMSHGSDHGNGSCITSVLQGIDCSASLTNFAMLDLHFEAFRDFVTPALNNVISLSTIIFLAYLSYAFWRKVFQIPSFRLNNDRLVNTDQRSISLFEKIISWLSFHENSPTFS